MKRLCAVVVLVSIAAPAGAATVRRLSLEQLRDGAGAIFAGRAVASAVVRLVDGLEATRYTIEVDEVLFGRVPARTTVGFIGGNRVYVAGSPRLEIGKRYVFFRTPEPHHTTLGWGQGLISIEKAGIQTLLVTGEGHVLRVVGGRLARGERIAIEGGRIRTIESNHARDTKDTGRRAVGGAESLPPPPPPPAAARDSGRPATLDDLRAFVAARKAGK